jgi:tetratricopeptide (TPR) repeat protein
MSTHTRTDSRGVPVTTASREAIDQLEHAVLGMLGHRADTGQHLQAALALDPELVPALCMNAFAIKCLARPDLDPAAISSVRAARAALEARGGSAREEALVCALENWCAGRPLLAAASLRHNIRAYPRDLLGPKLHHALHFILGRSAEMRAATALCVEASQAEERGYGYILGCHAFALEETGELSEAERVGRRAVELEPLDAWGAHAVAHVLESQDRALEGLRFMDATAAPFGGCNNFAGHLAWHRGLFLLQLERYGEALALYDRSIAVHLGRDYRDVCNASSLLFRLEQQGVSVGDRWQALAELARERSSDHASAFADAHYVLSLGRAGDRAAAASFAAGMRAASTRSGDAARISARVGVPVADGIVALCESRAEDAVRALAPTLRGLRELGGSNAQRDLFWYLLVEAALLSRSKELAHSLLSHRLATRPNHRFALERLKQLAAVSCAA